MLQRSFRISNNGPSVAYHLYAHTSATVLYSSVSTRPVKQHLPKSPTLLRLKRIILIPTLPNHTRARFLKIVVFALYLVRRVRSGRQEKVVHDLAAGFARGSLQKSTLRDVELHGLGRRHDERVVLVRRLCGEESRGAVPGARRAG
jgi:hypothetical protein